MEKVTDKIETIYPVMTDPSLRSARINLLINMPACELVPLDLKVLTQLQEEAHVYGQPKLIPFQLDLRKEVRIKQILALSHNQLAHLTAKENKQLIIEIKAHLVDQRLKLRLKTLQALLRTYPASQLSESHKSEKSWFSIFSSFFIAEEKQEPNHFKIETGQGKEPQQQPLSYQLSEKHTEQEAIHKKND